MAWTSFAIAIYLLCSQIPLYGAIRQTGSDPLYWLRVILASNRGTLMELGISPVLTASWIIHIMIILKIVRFDSQVQEDRQLVEGIGKVLGLIITTAQALTYILSGQYGNIYHLGWFNACLILAQLILAGLICILLDELLGSGYGFATGINLFITLNVCEHIFWFLFSPITIVTSNGVQFQGAFIAAIHSLATEPNKMKALKNAMFRTSAPNLSNFFSTLFMASIMVYFSGFKRMLPMGHVRLRGIAETFKVKLFYVSSMPVIIQSSVIRQIYKLQQYLYLKAPTNIFMQFLGTWRESKKYSQKVYEPVGGLFYYISPVSNMNDVYEDPVRALTYTLFMMVTCGYFAYLYCDLSGKGPVDQAKYLKRQGFYLTGFRDKSMISVLQNHIYTACILGGSIIGFLTVLGDVTDAIGSSTGILLCCSSLYKYFEAVTEKQKQAIY